MKWLCHVGERVGGVPRFVLNDAKHAYGRAIKEANREGCTEQGLLLASLELALSTHMLEDQHSRTALCRATSGRVDAKQLEAAAAAVKALRQPEEESPLHRLPPAAHFAVKLSDDLLRASKTAGKGGGGGGGGGGGCG